ncbi:MAG: phosphoglycolate phosphatase [Neptuniibacter caesariensis]|uniref:Phosphoglycolate phosphatase n=1 Tax=Neptuniibacter caesariensis TaxID=207954 RepID=A0A2G6JMV8_NEPCE|nr:MAG: phosphoglycolate phosphatase [Neptuniibacter caesariensis]
MYLNASAVLFDLDGTLIDTAPDFHAVINMLLEEEGKPGVSYPFIRQHVSNGARAMIAAAFNQQEGMADFDRLHQRMLDIYRGHLAVESKVFPGINECLTWLNDLGIPWGIVTNKPERYTIPLMRGLNLLEHSASIICPDHVVNRKPHPEPLFMACNQMNRDASHCIYVGDHIRDIEAGNRAGMTTIGATYGYLHEGEDPQEWQANHYIGCATELKPLLQSMYTEQGLLTGNRKHV